MYNIVFRFQEFPKYYKLDYPHRFTDVIEDSRINELTGKQEFKIIQKDGFKSTWIEGNQLEHDSVGQMYGERHGLYGLSNDAYGSSTRERMRTFLSRKYAVERLEMYNQMKKSKRLKPIGIRYSRCGLPEAATSNVKED